MIDSKKITAALISVYHKTGLQELAMALHQAGITIYATGGTQVFLEGLNVPVVAVDSVTQFPEVLGGRVKTLHPKIFGGILHRRSFESDLAEVVTHQIPTIDMVVVDLYPFEQTVANGGTENDIIEKIDVGGVSLIRAAAKNFNDVLIIPAVEHYPAAMQILNAQQASSTLAQRRDLAKHAFTTTANYDAAIQQYFLDGTSKSIPAVHAHETGLRYGENPHQKAVFRGKLDDTVLQLHGKDISYNNLLDIDAAIQLIAEFDETTFAILKHNNACGIASRSTVAAAYQAALACDPTSAFGGVLITNATIELDAAALINDLFCEVVIAPHFTEDALQLLKSKKNRILLVAKKTTPINKLIRSVLNGWLEQDRDSTMATTHDWKLATVMHPNSKQTDDLLFANKIVKHTKSNTIVLAANKTLVASGTGQTSRVDALQQAISKAKFFNFDLQQAVMASDAFFPFPDCVQIAHHAGIKAVIQPGGSIKDQESIDYCNAHQMSMVITGIRHFKH